MKAYSLWQPWASAIFIPFLKPIETRHWSTSFRGPLAIHAAKKETRQLKEFFHKRLSPDGFDKDSFYQEGIESWSDLPLGALIGTVELVDCVPTAPEKGTLFKDREAANAERFSRFCAPGMWENVEKWGDFSPDRFGHCFAKIRKFPEPIPWRGAQGFFEVTLPEGLT
jgi:hypothetical protein